MAQRFKKALEHLKNGDKIEIENLEALKEICWEKLHTGHWKDVPVEWRDAFALSQFMIVVARSEMKETFHSETKDLDLALMMGGDRFRTEIETLIQKLGQRMKKRDLPAFTPSTKKQKSDFRDLPMGSLRSPGRRPRFETVLSVEDFCERYLRADRAEPCIFQDLTKNWPAFQKWQDLKYFEMQFGYRTVPIEIGRHYLEEDWGQEMMTMTAFLERDFASSQPSKSIGYLAQHPLFDQIPELRKDICIPEYCLLNAKEGEPVIHAWFGPKGTVSPLHFDTSLNILTQVVGEKYIRLYDPMHSEILRPFDSSMNKNSSQIDLDCPSEIVKYGIEELEFVDLVLKAGDGIFIPKGWWHYVRSLDASFSVSFWWNRD